MLFSPFERMVAWRYLRTKRQDSFVSVVASFSFLGILLGVTTLIVVMAVMNGFRHELLGRIVGVNGHLALVSNEPILRHTPELIKKIRDIDEITGAHPVVERQIMVMANGIARGAVLHGMRASDFKAHCMISSKIILGNLNAFGQPGTAIIGSKMAQRFGVPLGGSITIAAPGGEITPLGMFPRFKKFRVVAMFDIGMREYDSTFIYVPLVDAQRFFRMEDGVTGIEVFVKDPNALEQQKQSLGQATKGYNVRTFDWQQANASFFTVLQVERNVMFVILMLIVLVAAFNIISSLVMLVKDKSRDIAIMRTMGASTAMIQRLFMMVGSAIGLIGTLGGTALGLLIALNIDSLRKVMEYLTQTTLFPDEFYFLSQLPSRVEWQEVVLVVVTALALAFFATLYPAWRASKTDPTKALRYE